MITDSILMNSMAISAANREAELMRIIEEKDAQICKLRHALNSLEQKHGRLLREMRKKGGGKDDG